MFEAIWLLIKYSLNFNNALIPLIALKTILTNFNQRLIFTFDVPEDQKCFQDSFYFYFTSAKKNRRLNKRSGKIRRGQGEWGNAF